MHGDGYVFEDGELVVAIGTSVVGVVMRRRAMGRYDDMFTYDVHWTAEYAGICGIGWTPCEIAPLDRSHREEWKRYYPSHGDSPWHSCVSCAFRAMADM